MFYPATAFSKHQPILISYIYLIFKICVCTITDISVPSKTLISADSSIPPKNMLLTAPLLCVYHHPSSFTGRGALL